MKRKTLAAIVAFPLLLLPFASNAAPPAAAVQVVPKTTEAKPKLATTMKTDAVMALPGEKKTFKALLTQKGSNAPVANRKVTFRIDGRDGKTPHIVIGSDNTDNEGRATIEFAV